MRSPSCKSSMTGELEDREGIGRDGVAIYDLDVENSTHGHALHWLADDVAAGGRDTGRRVDDL